MAHPNLITPKPITQNIRPEITRLPQLTLWRQLARHVLIGLVRLMVWALTKTEVSGLENIPSQGAAVIVINHLGDADLVVGLAFAPRYPEIISKAELRDYPVLGWLMEAYGVIWVHRGQPDRRALRAALQGLAEGRLLGIAPEGRESLTGDLEEGTNGAAYLALKSNQPVIPVTVTGTENSRIFPNLKKLRQTKISLTIGPLFRLEPCENLHTALRLGTIKIMHTLASQLPPEYRGVYANELENSDDSG